MAKATAAFSPSKIPKTILNLEEQPASNLNPKNLFKAKPGPAAPN